MFAYTLSTCVYASYIALINYWRRLNYVFFLAKPYPCACAPLLSENGFDAYTHKKVASMRKSICRLYCNPAANGKTHIIWLHVRRARAGIQQSWCTRAIAFCNWLLGWVLTSRAAIYTSFSIQFDDDRRRSTSWYLLLLPLLLPLLQALC